MKVGFTGSRREPTAAQFERLYFVLREMVEAGSELHHGDCEGMDARAHELALTFGYKVVIHPPDNPKSRAFCKGASDTLPQLPYLMRNRRIVDACNVLVACPAGPEALRSGTWSTVRYARKRNKRVILITPGGEIL